jgi:hypothetical protein
MADTFEQMRKTFWSRSRGMRQRSRLRAVGCQRQLSIIPFPIQLKRFSCRFADLSAKNAEKNGAPTVVARRLDKQDGAPPGSS